MCSHLKGRKILPFSLLPGLHCSQEACLTELSRVVPFPSAGAAVTLSPEPVTICLPVGAALCACFRWLFKVSGVRIQF